MNLAFEKYDCNDKRYLIYDPSKNDEVLNTETIRNIRRNHYFQDLSGIVEGPFINNNLFGVKMLHTDGSVTVLSNESLDVFGTYLKDEGYMDYDATGSRKEYSGITAEKPVIRKTGRIYLTVNDKTISA